MTVKRYKFGKYIFSCNYPGCGAECIVAAGSFTNAWRQAKAQNWVTVRVGAVWMHYCDWVHRHAHETNLRHAAIDAAMRGPIAR
jgi:hypothetical protein